MSKEKSRKIMDKPKQEELIQELTSKLKDEKILNI